MDFHECSSMKGMANKRVKSPNKMRESSKKLDQNIQIWDWKKLIGNAICLKSFFDYALFTILHLLSIDSMRDS